MRIVLFLTFFLICIRIFANQYYVSPEGDNTNGGTSVEDAWLTIQHALNSVTSGDTILIIEGTFFESVECANSGESGNYITIKNYNDDVVTIDGSYVGNGIALYYAENKNYIRIEGLKFTNHNGNYQPIINFYGSNSHIEIKNCEFFNTICNDSYAILIEGSGDDFIISNNYFHDLMGVNAVGVLFVGSDNITPFTNIRIIQNTLEHIEPAPSEAIAVNGNIEGFEIMSNFLSDINNIGVVMIRGEDWVNTNAEVNFARNGVCKWNTVEHANSEYGGGYAAGIYVDGGKNIYVENNTVTHCDIGLEIGCENHGFKAENNIVRNNILFKNEKSGLGFGGYDYPATGNVLNCTFTGNTVFDNDSLNSGFGQLWIQHAENCVVKNNIFYASQVATLINAYDWDIYSLGNVLDYNLYYYPGGEPHFYIKEEFISGYENYLATSLLDVNSIFINPQFVDDYSFVPELHIKMNSPAIDKGDPLYSASIDEFDSDSTTRIYNAIVDIGADEFSEPVIAECISSMRVKMYPNPSHENLFIENSDNSKYYITLLDLYGRQIFFDERYDSDLISLKEIPAGIYIIKINTTEGVYQQKIEIQ